MISNDEAFIHMAHVLLAYPLDSCPQQWQASEDGDCDVLRLLHQCAFSLARAVELIDRAGLILTPAEADATCRISL